MRGNAMQEIELENEQLRAANARLQERAQELEGRLAGALHALRDLRDVVPPRDWRPYAQQVLALEACSPCRKLMRNPG